MPSKVGKVGPSPENSPSEPGINPNLKKLVGKVSHLIMTKPSQPTTKESLQGRVDMDTKSTHHLKLKKIVEETHR